MKACNTVLDTRVIHSRWIDRCFEQATALYSQSVCLARKGIKFSDTLLQAVRLTFYSKKYSKHSPTFNTMNNLISTLAPKSVRRISLAFCGEALLSALAAGTHMHCGTSFLLAPCMHYIDSNLLYSVHSYNQPALEEIFAFK